MTRVTRSSGRIPIPIVPSIVDRPTSSSCATREIYVLAETTREWISRDI